MAISKVRCRFIIAALLALIAIQLGAAGLAYADSATTASGVQKLEANARGEWSLNCAAPTNPNDASLCNELVTISIAREANRLANRNMWLSLAGLVAVAIGLFYTSRSFLLGKRALTSVERAFVFNSDIRYDTIGNEICFRVIWRNSGSTPATRAMIRTSWRITDLPLPDFYDFPDLGPGNEVVDKFDDAVPVFFGPGAEVVGMGIDVPVNDFDEVMKGVGHLYIWGWVEYDDILGGARHRTEFCSKVSPMARKVFTATEPGRTEVVASIVHHRQHNAADDECMKRPDPYPVNVFHAP